MQTSLRKVKKRTTAAMFFWEHADIVL